jgi:hypothetical protein
LTSQNSKPGVFDVFNKKIFIPLHTKCKSQEFGDLKRRWKGKPSGGNVCLETEFGIGYTSLELP